MSKKELSVCEKAHDLPSTERSYLDRIRIPGEEIVYIAHLHWTVYAFGIAAVLIGVTLFLYGYPVVSAYLGQDVARMLDLPMAMVAIVLAASGAAHLFFAYLRLQSTDIVVTDQRVIIKSGHLATRFHQTLLSKISSVNVAMSLPGRLLGYGLVIVHSAGGGMPILDHVKKPHQLHLHIMAMIRRLQVTGEETAPFYGMNAEKQDEPLRRRLGKL